MLHPSQNRGHVRVAELFGRLAGWSYAPFFDVEPPVIIERNSRVPVLAPKFGNEK